MVSITPRGVLRASAGLFFVVALVLLLVVAFPQVAGADHSYVVVSGSMEPTYEPGDVVFVEETQPEAIAAGDVITFERDGTRTTHRVVEVVPRDEGPHFRTQGDANEDPDQRLVTPDQVLGRVAFTIPYVGHVLVFARTDLGVATLVILPAALLILSEAWTLTRAVRADRTDDPADEEPRNAQSTEDD